MYSKNSNQQARHPAGPRNQFIMPQKKRRKSGLDSRKRAGKRRVERPDAQWPCTVRGEHQVQSPATEGPSPPKKAATASWKDATPPLA